MNRIKYVIVNFFVIFFVNITYMIRLIIHIIKLNNMHYSIH